MEECLAEITDANKLAIAILVLQVLNILLVLGLFYKTSFFA